MKTSTRRQPSSRTQQETQSDEMPDPREIVEHQTIPQFIRRAPHHFHLDEITRFGDKVSRIAESMQVSYLTTIDRSLGVIRLFPLPLMVRVYQVLATQFHWEPWNEVITLEDATQAEALKTFDRAKRHLQNAALRTDIPPEVSAAMATALEWLNSQTKTGPSPGDASPGFHTV